MDGRRNNNEGEWIQWVEWNGMDRNEGNIQWPRDKEVLPESAT